MLRRKLLLSLAPLVVMLMVTAAGAIWLLGDVLRDLNHIDTHAWTIVEQVNELSITVNAIEVDLYELQSGVERHLDGLIERIETARALVERIGEHYVARQPEFAGSYGPLRDHMPEFSREVGAMATAQDPTLSRQHLDRALSEAVELRRQTLPLSRMVRGHAQGEQAALVRSFRWVVLGLGIAFLLVINIAVMVLLRTAGMILRPVERLVAGSRELAAEHFDHRVVLSSGDEFSELAGAFNRLGEQLQSNEQRKMEVLAQVATTLNHELNNALAIIELQLSPLLRASSGNPRLERSTRQIQETLTRMAKTVDALKRVRRIVLTDYMEGVKMLDLERSVREESEPARGEGGAETSGGVVVPGGPG